MGQRPSKSNWSEFFFSFDWMLFVFSVWSCFIRKNTNNDDERNVKCHHHQLCSELRENISDSFRFGFCFCVLCDNLISEMETQLFNGRRCRSHSVTISPPGHIWFLSYVLFFRTGSRWRNEWKTTLVYFFLSTFIFEFFYYFRRKRKGTTRISFA